MSGLPTLIAGGGIAGLAASLGLAKLKQHSIVLEQASDFEEIGAGLQLGPNAVKALQWLNAWDFVSPGSVTPSNIIVRDGHSGRCMQRIQLGAEFENRFGAPYRVSHRADLLAGLLEAARNSKYIELRSSSRFLKFEDESSQVKVALQGGEIAYGIRLVGADGIHSSVRQQLFADGSPIFRGHTIYRALADRATIPPHVESDAVCLWLCKGGHLVHYLVSGGKKLNVVAAIDQNWVSSSWNEIDDGVTLKQIFGNTAGPLSSLFASVPQWRKWAGADLSPLQEWSKGNVTLVGDAAHATLPYLAQGAAMSLEDAVVLARTLDRPSRLSALRQARTTRVQTASRQLGRIYHLSGPGRIARNLAMQVAPNILDRLAWLYAYDPTKD